MTVLDHEFHGKIHIPVAPLLVFAALAAMALTWAIGNLTAPAPQTAPQTAPAESYYGCAAGDMDCEATWLLENLTEIEKPILVLPAEQH